jgi:hypothetical protein
VVLPEPIEEGPIRCLSLAPPPPPPISTLRGGGGGMIGVIGNNAASQSWWRIVEGRGGGDMTGWVLGLGIWRWEGRREER